MKNRNYKEIMSMGSIFGYARVSSKEQNEDRQIIALKEIGVSSYVGAGKFQWKYTLQD